MRAANKRLEESRQENVKLVSALGLDGGTWGSGLVCAVARPVYEAGVAAITQQHVWCWSAWRGAWRMVADALFGQEPEISQPITADDEGGSEHGPALTRATATRGTDPLAPLTPERAAQQVQGEGERLDGRD